MPARRDDTLVYTTASAAADRRGRKARGSPAPARGRARRDGAPAGAVRIWLERQGRGGPASIVRGLALPAADLAALATRLKRLCGAGGSAKDGEIIIQGDHRTRIAAELERDGIAAKLAGG